ncbi:MAG: P1 family peptidase [Deltaproteobacteria bacterium]|nr:P1 family peptidase [Deltaproteobacteria bacterium]
MAGRITDVPGVLVGCAEDREAMTGVTVVLCEDGATFACLTPGPATSTRQADAGRPEHLVQVAHAVCLAGGSAFGLGASTGVMDYLAERGAGHRVRDIVVPTVPSAVIFDRSATPGLRRPDAAMARQACASASADVPRGSVGAGCGATVGKALGIGHS